MKLYGADGSPYVRKVLVVAAEAGLEGEIERVMPATSVWVGAGDAGVAIANPIGKVPVLTTRDGDTLIDSTLICEYLASLAPESGLLPINGLERWRMLRGQRFARL